MFHPYNKPLTQKNTLKIQKNANLRKYLGILIDSILSWKNHIDNVSTKVSRYVGLLYKIGCFVDTKIMKTLFYNIVYLHLIYGIEVWGSADETHLKSYITKKFC